MRRPATIHRLLFSALAVPAIAVGWWGCAEGNEEDDNSATSGTGASGTTTVSASSGATGGAGASGGEGGAGGEGACTSVSETAAPIPLDLIIILDRSGSMQGVKWTGTKSALSSFFDDPASEGIAVGMVYFPTIKPFADVCSELSYKLLDVPIDTLPENSFALTNSMPANATGGTTPTHAALKGALMAATAYQDANPEHKVNVVLATDGDPNGCEEVDIDDIADLAKSARDYNGVHTYVIGVEGSVLPNLHKIAKAGGTEAAYDVTVDISEFAETMDEIRSSALACEFGIPPPPGGEVLVPDEVNFTYTPGGTDMPVTIPRAQDLADCGDEPGWYYDFNPSPTKIILCPASCTTVQNDAEAAVAVAFGCQSILK